MMPGTGTAVDILYGRLGVRTAPISKANDCLPLPAELDPRQLNAAALFEVDLDQIYWTGGGSDWLARGRILPEWEEITIDQKAAAFAQEATPGYLESIDYVAAERQKTLYDLSRPISFDDQSPADDALFSATEEDPDQQNTIYRIRRQRLAVIERIAGAGGEWRLMRLELQSVGALFLDAAYFINGQFHGSTPVIKGPADRR